MIKSSMDTSPSVLQIRWCRVMLHRRSSMFASVRYRGTPTSCRSVRDVSRLKHGDSWWRRYWRVVQQIYLLVSCDRTSSLNCFRICSTRSASHCWI